MKTIYTAVIARLTEKVPALKWVDMDKGQLKETGDGQKPSVAYPCALISIAIPKSKDITDTIQDCTGTIGVLLAFDPFTMNRTAAQVEEAVREQHLEPYEVIADTYVALQGWGTDNFNPLSRTSQGEDKSTNKKLFSYKINFSTQFEDETAEG